MRYFFLFLSYGLVPAMAIGQNITYTPLHTSTTFDGHSIDVAKPVGSTPGQSSVSPTGGAIYSIPFHIPPGTNGVSPTLSLEYNSQGGPGLVGMGWNIAGVSAISRVAQNVYFDGVATPVQFDGNDRFSLDGQRLVLKQGTYGVAGSEYGIELEGFSLIKLLEAAGGGQGWFELTSKDGVKMHYGSNPNGRFSNDQGTATIFWMLNRMIFPDGNYIDYEYVASGREEPRLSRVRYTGNLMTGAPTYNEIALAYKVRESGDFSDVRTVYLGGASMSSRHLLDNVTVRVEGSVAKSYDFAYGNDGVNSFLKSVQEGDGQGNVLNPTIFKYGDTPPLLEEQSTTIPSGNNIVTFAADFNSDGLNDILTTDNPGGGNVSEFRIWAKSSASATNYSLFHTQPLPSSTTIYNWSKVGRHNGAISSDMDGDGRADVVTMKVGATEMFTGGALQDLKLYKNTSVAGNFFSQITLPIPENFTGVQSAKTWIQLGDFNGDGKTEYLLFLAGIATLDRAFIGREMGGNWGCSQLNPVGNLAIPVSNWRSSEVSQAIDFDGDGKMELLLIRDNLCEIYAIDGTTVRSVYSRSDFNRYFEYFFGDFNSDGKTDILQYDSVTSTFVVYTSTGKTLLANTFPLRYFWPSDANHVAPTGVVVGDFNGDGKSDVSFDWRKVRHTVEDGSAFTYMYSGHDIYYSTGNSFKHKQLRFLLDVIGPYQPNSNLPQVVSDLTPIFDTPVDLNGDGKTDIFSVRNGFLHSKFFNRDGNDLRLEKVKTGVNHQSQWVFRKSAADSDLYTNGTSQVTFPLARSNPGWVLVGEFRVSNGLGSTRSVFYKYQGATFHRQGKGFIGFEENRMKDGATGIETITTGVVNPLCYAMLPKTTTVSYSGVIRGITDHESEVVVVNGRSYWVKNKKTTHTDPLSSVTTVTEQVYDSFANIIQKTVSIPGVHLATTETEYAAYPGSIPNKPTLLTITQHRNGSVPYSVKTRFVYNGLGQLQTKVDFFEQAKAVTVTYGYNNLGNPTTTGLSASGVVSRGKTVVFDSKGRFPVQSVNEMGQQSASLFDPKWGQPLALTAVDGLTTEYRYNSWGQNTRIIHPEGHATDIEYHWDLSGLHRYYQKISTPGQPVRKVWYDVLGRETKTESQAWDGSPVIGTVNYDEKGNVSGVREPCKLTETPVTTTNFYDTFNRIVQASHSISGLVSYSYHYLAGGILRTRTQAPSGISLKMTDASGQLVASEDDGGVLSYSYYSHGGMREVKNGAGKVLTAMEYDPYVRQVKLTDISAGVTEYEHDALGQLIQQKAANGAVTSMQYNLLGQITVRTGAEGTTSYVYGTTNSEGDRINQIKSVTGFNGENRRYRYDDFGRLGSVTEDFEGTYTTSYSYNPMGALVATTYPSGLVVTQHYNSLGYLDEIKRGNEMVYKTLATNGRGQVTDYRKGNGKNSTVTYTNGAPTHYATTGVQDYHLVWDVHKNILMSRRDARAGVDLTETFTYDHLNRLSSNSHPGTTFSTSYTLDGNIESKTDAGTYTYHTEKSHAVIRVSNSSPSSIPRHQQDITYTSFMQPAVVSENAFQFHYEYGADYQRIKCVGRQTEGTLFTRYYFEAGFEKEIRAGVTRYIHYISAPVGLVALIESVGGNHTEHYTYTDHLGSILTVTSKSGIIEAEQSFDAWGRRRHPTTWAHLPPTEAPPVPLWLYRGYTSHEHLDEVGLINMNGRMYDPVLGRMLSPDNYVVDPLYSQDYNRYMYARNNPLVYVDPDGEFWHIVIGAGLGGVVNLGVQAISGNINGFGDGLAAFGKGALIGGMSAIGCSSCAVGTLAFGAATAVGSSYIPSHSISMGSGFSLNIGGNVGYGSTGLFTGMTIGLSFDSDYFSLGVSYGVGLNLRDNIAGRTGWSSSLGGGMIVGVNDFRLGLFTNQFAGRGLTQQTGTFYLESNGWSAQYENDYMFKLPIADGGDRFRTAGVRVAKGDFSVGLNLFTGDPGKLAKNREVKGENPDTKFRGTYIENSNRYRLGALYGGYQGYRAGWNSEGIRHVFQNQFAHRRGFLYPLFEVLKSKGAPYFNYYNTNNRFTTWY
jgi:RHS repeat-associated protein